MKKKKKIAYSFLIGDLFHYGHLKRLETAEKLYSREKIRQLEGIPVGVKDIFNTF